MGSIDDTAVCCVGESAEANAEDVVDGAGSPVAFLYSDDNLLAWSGVLDEEGSLRSHRTERSHASRCWSEACGMGETGNVNVEIV